MVTSSKPFGQTWPEDASCPYINLNPEKQGQH